jgi:Transposase DDE domain group 1
MNNCGPKHASREAHQTVTEEWIEVPTPTESIRVGFTDQKVSGRAGLASFAGFLHWHGMGRRLRQALPALPVRLGPGRKPLPMEDLALGFITGILAGAQKLTQVAYLRSDPLVAPLLAIQRVASQSTFTRFFARFGNAAVNLRSFRPLWRWGLERLPSRPGGYCLDLDSTRLLHEDGHQEGVAVGYTRLGTKPCLHPLLAVLEEPKLVVNFWLRPGNCGCANNVVPFTLEVLDSLPSYVRLRLVRADSGFCETRWLDLLESQELPYIVVARLLQPIARLCRKETIWQPSEVPGTDVAEVWHRELGWARDRRVILVRHHIEEKERPGGKKLLDVPGYLFQAFVTNLPATVAPIEVWRDYNGRAGCEGVIKQLDADFALDKLCLQKFFATEAAMVLAVFAYNLCVLFQRHLGCLERVTAATLRFRLFTTGGIISRSGGRTTIRLAVPPAQRDWWRSLFEKLLCPWPNCNSFYPAW